LKSGCRQNAYREISSCSTFGEFQARRAQIRFRTGARRQATPGRDAQRQRARRGRTVVALLENGQQADGSVILPQAIRPYMGGLERLTSL